MGELRRPPATTAGHQRVVGNLYLVLRAYADQFGGNVFLAPLDVILGHYDIAQPDVLFLSAKRDRLPDDEYAVNGPPELVVEVVSPRTGWIDWARKSALYATYRVPEYWIADPPRRAFAIHVLEGDQFTAVVPDADGLIASRVLPGLRVDSAEVFAGLN